MSTSKRFCVIGYASLDHKYLVAPFEGAGRTTIVRDPVNAGRPEPGAVSYFARAIARGGGRVDIVSWVANDALGEIFCQTMLDTHVGTSAVSRSGDRSPQAHMFYPANDEPITFFDPGTLDQKLTAKQRRTVKDADVVVATVAPPDALTTALDTLSNDAVLMWTIKSDPASMSPTLAARLAARAQIITYSASEADFLREHCRLDPLSMTHDRNLVIETRGASGAAFYVGGKYSTTAPGRAITARDQTGAGDTFAGSLIVSLSEATDQPPDFDVLITRACDDTAHFLASRQ